MDKELSGISVEELLEYMGQCVADMDHLPQEVVLRHRLCQVGRRVDGRVDG